MHIIQFFRTFVVEEVVGGGIAAGWVVGGNGVNEHAVLVLVIGWHA